MLKVTAVREQRGWSRTQLALKALMHPAQVGQLELGRIPKVWPAWRQRLAMALSVDEEDLFEKDGRPLEVEVDQPRVQAR